MWSTPACHAGERGSTPRRVIFEVTEINEKRGPLKRPSQTCSHLWEQVIVIKPKVLRSIFDAVQENKKFTADDLTSN